ncbi:hypothetical protein BOTBODRAFT_32128, partial [Botryobasidium botryosum FD-172 SS1]
MLTPSSSDSSSPRPPVLSPVSSNPPRDPNPPSTIFYLPTTPSTNPDSQHVSVQLNHSPGPPYP